MAPVLGYWDIRGVAESVRYMLHYVGEKFEDKRYKFGEGEDMFKGEWFSDKYNLGLDLPNLPYYIDGNVKITQSPVILRFLARKYGLYFPVGNGDEALNMEIIEGHIRDFFHLLMFVASSSDPKRTKDMGKPRLVDKVQQTSTLLAENDWLMGDKLSHVDFLLYELIDVWMMLIPDLLDGMENLVRHKARFAELPGVKEYLKTSKKWPIFAPLTNWGGGDECELKKYLGEHGDKQQQLFK